MKNETILGLLNKKATQMTKRMVTATADNLLCKKSENDTHTKSGKADSIPPPAGSELLAESQQNSKTRPLFSKLMR